MITVQFPAPQFRLKKRGEKQYIFDGIRKRWLLLTEEEWVRQNIVAYFITSLSYPKEVIALEKEIVVNGLKKRFDILIYNADHQPWMLVECKAPVVPLNDEVLQQVLRYHISLPVRFIVLTNGKSTVAWKKTDGTLKMLSSLPIWTSLNE
jgi:hypothetical protein